MDVDDDSDNDSDYAPEKDKDNAEIVDESNGEKSLVDMSASRKRKSNTLWEEMQSEEIKFNDFVAKKRPAVKSVAKSKKTQDILASIFGSKVARKLVTTAHEDCSATSAEVDVKALIKDSVNKIVKKQKVTEVRKFAGGEIRCVAKSGV